METLIPTHGGAFDVAHALRGEGFDASEDGMGRGTPLVPVAFPERMSGTQCAAAENVSPALGAVNPTAVAFAQNTRDEVRLFNGDGSIAGALAAEQGMKQQTYVAEPMVLMERGRNGESNLEYRQDGTANAPLTPNGGRGGFGVGAIQHNWAVRRLTPTECSRLQGFPDDFTRIEWRGKPAANCPDGPRYKALGNSWAVPCGAWILARLARGLA